VVGVAEKYGQVQLEETPKSAAAFYEYCLLGADRSLAKLAQKLGKSTAYIRCLETWSSHNRWQERVREYDAEQARFQGEAILQERTKILKFRYALMHKRIEQLDRIAQKLLDYAEDEEKVWLPDVKAIGNGPGAERVDLVQFNDALFREIRAHFADIASELGERVKKTDTTVTVIPKTYLDLDPDEDGSEE